MLEAIIFDLDGTLWDSADCVCEAWNRVLERHEITDVVITRQTIESIMGKTMDEICEMLFPEYPNELRCRIADEFGSEENAYLWENGAILYDGLEDSLKKLSEKFRLYIVSNCQDGYAQAFLHAHKLGGYFADIEMSGRTGLKKDGNIKLIMERNGIRSAVYVGDTEGDERASRIAGVPFIYAAYGFGKALAPDSVLDDISQLPEIVKKYC